MLGGGIDCPRPFFCHRVPVADSGIRFFNREHYIIGLLCAFVVVYNDYAIL